MKNSKRNKCVLVKQLQGHSGCEVLLLKKDNILTVRKISPDVKYNPRILRQMEKQRLFSSNIFKTPNVHYSGTLPDGRKYFDMDFVNGQTFSNYIECSRTESSLEMFKDIFQFVEKNNYIGETIEHQIQKKVDDMVLQKRYHIFKEYSMDFDWSQINKSYCHGDLTFENILISGKQIYFIDFLDSFSNTVIIDYSKILQDIMLGWSWRDKETKPYIKTVLMYEYLVENIGELELEASKRMLVLNMLRILPYTKDNKTRNLIDTNLQFLKSEFIDE